MKFKMMQDPQYNAFPVSRKAKLLGVNRRSYYKWLQRPSPESQQVLEEMKIYMDGYKSSKNEVVLNRLQMKNNVAENIEYYR